MSAVRPAVRALRMPSAAARRFQSTSTDSAATKAAAGLNKVAASAGPAIASAAKALSNVGGPIGKAVAAVESMFFFFISYLLLCSYGPTRTVGGWWS